MKAISKHESPRVAEPVDLLAVRPDKWKDLFIARGLDGYRADQVLDWVFKKGVYEFGRMKNLPAAVRKNLADAFYLNVGEIAEKKVSEDGSAKLLIRFPDGQLAETVYMPRGRRRTVCLSSQVGCKFGCVFCASGQAGFSRNLTAGEIIAQMLWARSLSDTGRLTNVVFMGMGEPMDNLEAVTEAIYRINEPKLFDIGARKITVSTSGLVSKFERFARSGMQLELSVSLHGPNDEIRGKLMPVNRRWPVHELVEACREFTEKTRRVVTFEYLLAEGLNDRPEHAKELAELLRGLLCKVNLIPLNPIAEFPYRRPPYRDIVSFQEILKKEGISATVRFSRGTDIDAACGQLRRRHLPPSPANEAVKGKK